MYDAIKRIKSRQLKSIKGEIFLVSEKHVLRAKNGDEYIGLKLKDSSGVIDGKIWNNLIHLSNNFDESNFVMVEGESNYFKDNWQIIIKNIQKVDESRVNREQFFPRVDKDIDELKAEMMAMIRGVKHQGLRKLLVGIFNDEFMDKFSKAPAAKSMHHAYVGGLLEHSLSTAKLAKMIGEHYGDIDVDLLLACAFLHDVGKVDELDPTTFNYTTDGKLIGHIVRSYTMVQNKINELKVLSQDKAMRLLHCILSHHGEHEFGSPTTPKTKEAILFNLIDILDSRMQPVIKADKDSTSQWSEMVNIIGRNIYSSKDKNELFR